MKFLKKLTIGIIGLGMLFFLTTSSVQAQGAEGTLTTGSGTNCEAVNGTSKNMLVALLSFMSPALVDECYFEILDPQAGASLEKTTVGELPIDLSGGAITSMGSAIATIIETKPVSSREYFADIWNNIGLPGKPQPVYAQTGIGFNALQPVLPLWKAFRNVAYFFYVIIFVAIGFMIMFRAKLNPQTVVTVQTALPNLIITLILITFSYAIAGLLIDLIYVAIFVPAFALQTAGVFTSAGTVIERLMTRDLFGVLFGNPAYETLTGQTPEADVFVLQPAHAVGSLISNFLGGGLIAGLAGWVGDLLARLIFAAMLLIAMFKLFITLGIGFLRIILAVITAPIQILLNALPGSEAFSNWFRGLLANIAMFPAVAILFMIGAALVGPGESVYYNPQPMNGNPWGVQGGIGYSALNKTGSDAWTPPFLIRRVPAIGLQGEVTMPPFIALIGLFTVMLAPKVAEMTRDYFKVEASKYTSAIGESMGQATGILSYLPKSMNEQRRAREAAQMQARYIGQAIGDPNAQGR